MNQTIIDKLANVGLDVPNILLPKDGIDMSKWAVVACDQFTSDAKYWKDVEELVGDNPSTLKIVLPEIYLESVDKGERIEKINSKMKEYLDMGIVEEKFEGWVLVERTLNEGQTHRSAPTRRGLVVTLDLEKYDFHKGSKTLIRATEGTIESRIPPRLEIRKNALIELPHIMVLINDPNKTIIEPLFNEKLENIYNFDLMMDGGHIKGWKITEEGEIEKIADNLAKLISSDGLLFAMGDGNHSLATAKTYWEILKAGLSEEERMTHPARYALVELVNIHDDGLQFEPIHRVLFNVDAKDLLNFVLGDGQEVEMVVEGIAKKIKIKNSGSNLAVGNLQILLDEYIKLHPEVKIDYVHGDESVKKLAVGNTVGFLLKTMKKEELFATVEKDGALPRKTFSMGEAEEKRYYLEAKAIK